MRKGLAATSRNTVRRKTLSHDPAERSLLTMLPRSSSRVPESLATADPRVMETCDAFLTLRAAGQTNRLQDRG